MKALVVNGGSSSFKCGFYELGDGPLPVEAPPPLWEAHVEWSDGAATVRIRDGTSAPVESSCAANSLIDPLPGVLESLRKTGAAIGFAGHRILHGGTASRKTTPLRPEAPAAIRKQAEFAPSHN